MIQICRELVGVAETDTHLVAETGREVDRIGKRCLLEIEGCRVDLGCMDECVSAPEQLTHQDHPQIVGDSSAVCIVDQEMVWEAVVEMRRDGLVGVLRWKRGDGRRGGVLVCGGR